MFNQEAHPFSARKPTLDRSGRLVAKGSKSVTATLTPNVTVAETLADVVFEFSPISDKVISCKVTVPDPAPTATLVATDQLVASPAATVPVEYRPSAEIIAKAVIDNAQSANPWVWEITPTGIIRLAKPVATGAGVLGIGAAGETQTFIYSL